MRMKQHSINVTKLLQVAASGVIFLGALLAWNKYVDPVPVAENYVNFYLSFINYLRGSIEFSNDYFLLTKIVITDSAPLGSLWPAWLVSIIGLQSLFINEPYLLTIFLIIPLITIPLFFQLRLKMHWMLALSLFFFPPIQILLKEYSSASLAILYSLTGFLFIRSYMIKRRTAYLICSALFLFAAGITDLIGLILLFSLFQSYLMHAMNQPKPRYSPLFILITSIGCSLLFYHDEIFKNLFWSGFNPIAKLLIIILFAMPILIGSIRLAKSANQETTKPPRLFRNYWVLMIVFSLTIWQIMRGADSISSQSLAILTLLAECCGLLLIQSAYQLSGARGLQYIVILVTTANAFGLNELLPGQNKGMLSFSLILILIQSFLENRSAIGNRLVLVIFFLCSNFFPASDYLQEHLGGRGLLLSLHGAKNLHCNLLGWQKSEIKSIQEQIKSNLESLDLSRSQFNCVIDNLHFHTRLILGFPQNFISRVPNLKRLDDLPEEQWIQFLTHYHSRGNASFNDWLESEKFPIILEGIRPWDLNHTPAAPLSELIHNASRKSEIGMSLSHAWLSYLKKSGKLKSEYKTIDIPSADPRLKLHILKKLDSRKSDSSKLNLALSRVSLHLDIDLYSHTKPLWFDKLDPSVKQEILTRESLRIYRLGKEYESQANYLQASRYLRQATLLNPNNKEIRFQYDQIMSQIPESFHKLLDQ